jgi:hypothetical protein
MPRECPPASAGARPFRRACAGARPRFSLRHQLARIFVAQFVEREIRERGDLHGLGQQLGWIEFREAFAFAQVALGVREHRVPAWATDTPCRTAVSASCSARRSRTCMCTSPAAVSGRPCARAEAPAMFEMFAVAAVAQQLHGDPGAAREVTR